MELPGSITIPKGQIVDLLRRRGEQDRAEQADAELPERVDPQMHGNLLMRVGVDPAEVIPLLGGGTGGSTGGSGGPGGSGG